MIVKRMNEARDGHPAKEGCKLGCRQDWFGLSEEEWGGWIEGSLAHPPLRSVQVRLPTGLVSGCQKPGRGGERSPLLRGGVGRMPARRGEGARLRKAEEFGGLRAFWGSPLCGGDLLPPGAPPPPAKGRRQRCVGGELSGSQGEEEKRKGRNRDQMPGDRDGDERETGVAGREGDARGDGKRRRPGKAEALERRRKTQRWRERKAEGSLARRDPEQTQAQRQTERRRREGETERHGERQGRGTPRGSQTPQDRDPRAGWRDGDETQTQEDGGGGRERERGAAPDGVGCSRPLGAQEAPPSPASHAPGDAGG